MNNEKFERELDKTILILTELSEMLSEHKVPSEIYDTKSFNDNFRDLIETRENLVIDVCCLLDDLERKN